MGAQGFTGGGSLHRARFIIAFALGITVTTASVGVAAAGVVTQSAHTRVRASGLTAAERRAITVKSVQAVSDGSLGLIVTATFSGNIERYLGHGDLKSGLVALVLVSSSAGPSPGGLADQGGGFTPAHLPILTRSGKRVMVVPRTVDVFGAENMLHVRTPSEAGAVRNGDQVIFYVGKSGASQIGEIKLKVFARSPVAGGRRASTSGWRTIVSSSPAELVRLTIDQSNMSYVQLASPRNALSALLSAGIDPELRRQQQAAAALKASVQGYGTVVRAIRRARGLPRATKSGLAGDFSRAVLRSNRLKAESAAITDLISQVDALIKARTPPPPPPPPPPVQVVQTDAALSQNMAAQAGLDFSSTAPAGVPLIDVNDQLRYQQFSGLGAAMTDSSASLIGNDMSASQRAVLMQDLFGQPSSGSGLPAPAIHLNFLRVGIAATGAMTATPAYSYDDNPPGGSDPTLQYFSIQHDVPYILPTLQQARQINPSLEILASPWSSPAWMKTNDSLANQNASGSLIQTDYQLYAQYLVKFIQDYQAPPYNLPIDAITPANEPTSGSGGSPYPGLNLPESNEANFIANYLKPALTSAGLHPKIYGNDLSWDQFSNYANPLASDPNAGPDLAGISWHCYFGSPTVMSQLHLTNPGLDQIVDECSPEIRGFGAPEFLISTLRNWASVDAIWSVALDPNGQPIQTPNHCGGCRGIVSINQQTGAVTYRTEYYQLGQVSAFVQPGATRIDSPNFVTYSTDSSNIETVSSGLDDVAFLDPNGSKVLIAYNNSSAPITFAVQTDGRYFTYTIPAQAMTTFVWT